MPRSRLLMVVIAAALCGVIGVAVGISSSAAASSHKSHKASSGSRGSGHWTLFGPGGASGATGVPGLWGGAFPVFGLGGGAIHSVVVVPNSSGGFNTVTTDSGTLKSVSGDALTITEGTTSATYATPTITVGSDAKVLLDGKSSTLTALMSGDRVTITQVSGGTTTVFATASPLPSPAGRGGWLGRGFGGGRFGGPPPGATGASGASGTWHPRGPHWGRATGSSRSLSA